MTTLGKDTSIPLTKISSNDNLSNKRIDLYLRGGIFAVSYKALVLDLLTKRLSPSIISGFLINDAHKLKHSEAFLCKLLKKDNPDTFIKCFTDKPQ